MRMIAAIVVMLGVTVPAAHAQYSSVKPVEDEKMGRQRVIAETYQEAVACHVENLSFTVADITSLKAYFQKLSYENGLDQAVRDAIWAKAVEFEKTRPITPELCKETMQGLRMALPDALPVTAKPKSPF